MSMDYSDKLIYGKNPTERIVSIEVKDGLVELFIQKEDGSIEIQVEENYPWILCNENLGRSMVRLDGEQHYKWGKQFNSLDDFRKFYNMNFRRADLYTIHNMKENCMVNKGLTYFKGMKINEISVLSFDIETNGLKIDDDSVVYLISNTYRNNTKFERRLFSLDEYSSQVEMIEDWCKWVRTIDPSIILGHNINGYDFKFLMNICDLKLGRDNSIVSKNKQSSQFRIDGSMSLEYNKLHCYGREIVDTLFLSYRYDAVKKKYESYGLKQIVRQEGLEKTGRTFIDSSKIYKEWQDEGKRKLIKQYAIEDADDSLKLFDLMAPATFYLTQSVPKTFQEITCSATGSQINSVLVRSYLQDKHSIAKSSELTGQQVEGGISFAVPGIYNNVFKVDIKSCYPSQILRFKLYDKEKDPKANFYKLVEHFTLQRFEYKEKVRQGDDFYKNLDAMSKIFINSSYGVTNTNGLNYNSIELARKITSESRAVIDLALRWASGKDYKYWITKFYEAVKEKPEDRVYMSIPIVLNCPKSHDYIITPSDTDSISFCKKDQSKFTENEIKTLLGEINAISPNSILWEDDGVYDSVVAIRAKNYILRKGDKVTVKGSGLKKSTSEPAIKGLFNEFINCLANNKQDQLVSIYESYIKEAMNIVDMKRWVVRKTITSNVLTGERTNETKVMDAIKGTDYREGDRVYLYFKPDESLSLIEHYDGNYDKIRLVKKVYTAIQTFDTILDMKQFVNYALKKNKDILEDLVEKESIEKDWEISEEVRLR